MARPGVVVTVQDTPSTVSVPTDTGVLFATGLTDRGPLKPVLIHNMTDFVNVFGDRQAYSILYDALDVFFREGGYSAYISRVVGPAATEGLHNLLDGAAAISLVVTAIGPGAWSADYEVAVVAGAAPGSYAIHIIETASGDVVEDSGDLFTQQDAVNWSDYSDYVTISLGVAVDNPAVAAPVALSAGTDDRASITDAQWLAAQNLFTKDLGPGQVVQFGRTTSTAHSQLVAHAEANNRVALLDLQDVATAATLESDAAADRSRFAASFAPWVAVPGVSSGSGNRTVPPSCIAAGLIARNDPSLGPNHASAGRYGVSRYAIDLTQNDWDDVTREALNNAGVNVIRRLRGSIQIYGWRSLTNPATDPNWIDFGNGRLTMAISAELDQVGEDYQFDEIDGQNGLTINGFHDGLAAVMMKHYNSRELFGDDPSQAFLVDTGPSVNTLQTIADNQLNASVEFRAATMAEWVKINIIKRAVTEVV